jgi:serine/threonine protein phosphatase PrpC
MDSPSPVLRPALLPRPKIEFEQAPDYRAIATARLGRSDDARSIIDRVTFNDPTLDGKLKGLISKAGKGLPYGVECAAFQNLLWARLRGQLLKDVVGIPPDQIESYFSRVLSEMNMETFITSVLKDMNKACADIAGMTPKRKMVLAYEICEGLWALYKDQMKHYPWLENPLRAKRQIAPQQVIDAVGKLMYQRLGINTVLLKYWIVEASKVQAPRKDTLDALGAALGLIDQDGLMHRVDKEYVRGEIEAFFRADDSTRVVPHAQPQRTPDMIRLNADIARLKAAIPVIARGSDSGDLGAEVAAAEAAYDINSAQREMGEYHGDQASPYFQNLRSLRDALFRRAEAEQVSAEADQWIKALLRNAAIAKLRQPRPEPDDHFERDIEFAFGGTVETNPLLRLKLMLQNDPLNLRGGIPDQILTDAGIPADQWGHLRQKHDERFALSYFRNQVPDARISQLKKLTAVAKIAYMKRQQLRELEQEQRQAYGESLVPFGQAREHGYKGFAIEYIHARSFVLPGTAAEMDDSGDDEPEDVLDLSDRADRPVLRPLIVHDAVVNDEDDLPPAGPSPIPVPANARWKPRVLDLGSAYDKMYKNAGKALDEHADESQAYATQAEGLIVKDTVWHPGDQPPLDISYYEAEDQGLRDAMEDAHFCYTIDEGTITAVFDGHGGPEVAAFAKAEFPNRFSAALKANGHNVHAAFEQVLDDIQKEFIRRHADLVGADKDWTMVGSTAVISFIERGTNRVFTATLGDSEANIYRQFGAHKKSIPLSCVRDWSSEREAMRAAARTKDRAKAEQWPKEKGQNTKMLRINGVNVSRALGDVYDSQEADVIPGQIHKPKITVSMVRPGDLLVLACDGLKDYLTEEEIVQTIENFDPSPGKSLAQTLTDRALRKMNYFANDNVTVIVLAFEERVEPAPSPTAGKLPATHVDEPARGVGDSVVFPSIQSSKPPARSLISSDDELFRVVLEPVDRPKKQESELTDEELLLRAAFSSVVGVEHYERSGVVRKAKGPGIRVSTTLPNPIEDSEE